MRRLIIALVVIGIASFGIGMYFWNKPVASLENSKAQVSVTASKIVDDFEADEDAANQEYLGKVVAVSGVVKEAKSGDRGVQLTFETESMLGSVICSFASDAVELESLSEKVGSSIKVKGECTGYLMDVILERCVLVE